MEPSKGKKLAFAFVCMGLSLSSGCANVLSPTANTTSDPALQFDAEQDVSSGSWTAAITAINKMTSTYQARREVQVLLASAYAGRCGLNMLSLANTIGNSVTLLFPTLFAALPLAPSTAEGDCQQAEVILNGIAPAASRTNSENILMMFVELAKIGVIISFKGDANLDQVLDAGFLPCSSLALLTHNEANLVASAIGNLSLSAQAVGAAGSTTIQNIATGTQAVCAAVIAAGGSATYDLCSITDPAAVTANQRTSARTLLSESTLIGLNRPGGTVAAVMAGCIADP